MGKKEAYRGKQVLRNGKWEDGSASPEQKPEHLRGLPADWVTKNEADPDRIHELDPPHIVGALVEEQVKKVREQEVPDAPDASFKPSVAKPGECRPLSQWEIDMVRFRVMRQLVESAIVAKQHGVKTDIFKVNHLRFPENNVNIYELREGNPPRDAERAQHERGFALVLDIEAWPQSIVDHLATRGVVLPDAKKMLDNVEFASLVTKEAVS